MTRSRARAAAAVATLVLVAGCAGSGEPEPGPDAGPQAAATPPPAPPPPAAPAPAPPPPPPVPAPASTGPDPKLLEGVVRGWSAALNAGDDEAAADLFAPGAIVVQGDVVVELTTHDDAVLFNDSLPCSGDIVELRVDGDVVTAIFVLGDRKDSECDAPPGTRAAARFGIDGGKIVVWQQIPVPDSLEPPPADSGGELPAA